MEVEIKDSEDHPVVLFQLKGDSVKITEMCELWYTTKMNKMEFADLLTNLHKMYDRMN